MVGEARGGLASSKGCKGRVHGAGQGERAGGREQSCVHRVALVTTEATGKHWSVFKARGGWLRCEASRSAF